MELVLEGADHAPEGSVLSIKVGETRRQAPLSKIGQSFRFSSSPAEALPLKVEVLVPMAPAKSIMLHPCQKSFDIDIAGQMNIKMRQKVATDMQRPTPDVTQVAEARGLTGSKKKEMAATAAAYLEKHGLVRTFQDLLHGLLVSRPDDPWSYVDEHLAREKALATRPLSGMVPPSDNAAPRPPPQKAESDPAAPQGVAANPAAKTRGSIASRSKVDALMDILQRTHRNLPLILPYLPKDMSDMLVSEEFANECASNFRSLDTDRTGFLGSENLLPVLVQLSSANHNSVGLDQCRRFAAMFDANEDGRICLDEFTSLTQFIIIAAHLESAEGKDLISKVQGQEERFAEFLDILCQDKDRIIDIVPFLPDWVVDHLTSDKFIDECLQEFDALDKDKNQSLEPEELLPVILNLSKMNAEAVSLDRCKQFVNVFDVDSNGVIQRDEFLDFAQFIAVMNFLSGTSEGKQIEEAAAHAMELHKIQELIQNLEEDISKLPEVISYMPRSIIEELKSDAFKKECLDGFKMLDTNGNEVLDPAELFPVVMRLCDGHPIDIDYEVCKKFTAVFDKDRNGVICLGEFVTFCKFMVAMGYLHFAREWREDMVHHDRNRIESLLKLMHAHNERLDEVLPLLPLELQEELISDAFRQGCDDYFCNLDKDGNGTLEPRELVPVIIDIFKMHPFALTEEQCFKFVDFFDSEDTGVISRNEFVNLVRFVMVMAYLETEEGRAATDKVDMAMGEKKVEELLHMLEHDRNTMHKIIPLLPEKVFEDLTSDEFVEQCHLRFQDLDRDNNGALCPAEIYPVVVELSEAHPYSVDYEQCKRFTAIFDIYGDGVIRIEEFLDFARFLTIMSYMHSEQGKREFAEGYQILSDSREIEDLIKVLERDRHDIRKVIPYLPEEFRNELIGETFTLSCLERFKELDKDKSGSLDPTELYPIIMDMTSAHHLALDLSQCERFSAIFDDERTGVISQGEFVNFARFMMVMSFLQTEDGRTSLELAVADDQTALVQSAPDSEPAVASTSSQPASPQAVAHLSVDVDRYQRRVENLARENETQRSQMVRMEEKMRQMEERMELQERKLRQTKGDLKQS